MLKPFLDWGEGPSERVLEGLNSRMIYLIHHKNFCECHNVFSPSTIKIRQRKKRDKEMDS
jgi:hypothetical protein